MDDQDDVAEENAQDLLAAAGLEDSDAEDDMVKHIIFSWFYCSTNFLLLVTTQIV